MGKKRPIEKELSVDKKRIFRYFKPYLGIAVVSILLMSVYSAMSGVPAIIMKYMFNGVFIDKNLKMLWVVVALLVGSTALKGVANYFGSILSSYIATHISYDLRRDLYNHMINLPLTFYKKNKTGDLMARYTTSIPAFQQFLQVAFSFISKVMQLIAYFAIAFYTSWELTLILMVFILVIAVAMKYLGNRLYKTGKRIQEVAGSINSFVQETISGIQVIKGFSSEEFEKKGYESENYDNYNANFKNAKVSARVSPITDQINSMAISLLLILGGMFIIKGKLNSGDFLQLVTALALTADPIRYISQQFGNLLTNLAGVERVFEILDTENDIKEAKKPIELKATKGEISINHVYFKYSDAQEWILNDMTLSASPGETVALVGKSGGGKSTLVNMIPRFYDINQGEILIDGHNIKDYSKKSLRRNIGIVPQDTFLFNGTIRSNIAYGKEKIHDDVVIEAAKNANAWEFIKNLPSGLDTLVGERGTLLSGGQKQRISIARALLKNPKILILDEATSALDTESEQLVQDALDRLMKQRTTFVIAHRLSTIINADKIVVIKDGKIMEQGTHQSLLDQNGYYQELYSRQFNED